MSHTPGPWTYQEESDAYTHIVRSPTNMIVHQGPQWMDGVTEANARLIATAPELLEACKRLVENCKCTITQRLSGHLVDCPVDADIERTIAKAEGRS